MPHVIIYLYPSQVSKDNDDVTGCLVIALPNRYFCFAIVAEAVGGFLLLFGCFPSVTSFIHTPGMTGTSICL